VTTAASAAEALGAITSDPPHIIISDIGMPEDNGYALIQSIRALPQPDRAGIPAIALTAFARPEDRTRALVAGFNLHMTKPVEPSELLAAVAELLTAAARE